MHVQGALRTRAAPDAAACAGRTQTSGQCRQAPHARQAGAAPAWGACRWARQQAGTRPAGPAAPTGSLARAAQARCRVHTASRGPEDCTRGVAHVQRTAQTCRSLAGGTVQARCRWSDKSAGCRPREWRSAHVVIVGLPGGSEHPLPAHVKSLHELVAHTLLLLGHGGLARDDAVEGVAHSLRLDHLAPRARPSIVAHRCQPILQWALHTRAVVSTSCIVPCIPTGTLDYIRLSPPLFPTPSQPADFPTSTMRMTHADSCNCWNTPCPS
jgi:hypothetical protein